MMEIVLATICFTTLAVLGYQKLLEPPPQTPEEKLGSALSKYLSGGVKTKKPED